MDTLAAHAAQHEPDEGAGWLNSADQDLEDAGEDEAWWVAASRTSYRRSYRRSPTHRVFQPYELTGPGIDDDHQDAIHLAVDQFSHDLHQLRRTPSAVAASLGRTR